MRLSVIAALLAPTLVTGCTWDEGLEINNMSGTVVIPAEAATREFQREGGGSEIVTDVRLIGPVYLGLYGSISPEDTVASYPHPEVGPLFDPELVIGDTYPYGGTTVGNFKPVCFEDMRCRVITGRYIDFEDMHSWFADVLQDPIRDAADDPVVNGETIRQTCLSTFDHSNDAEMRLTVTEDSDGSGEFDAGDLDFVMREDGNFEAEFMIWQQEYFTNDAGDGFTLWGFMDTPAPGDGSFSTCSPERGFTVDEYSENFQSGAAFQDLLNRPSIRLQRGDWVIGAQPETGNLGYTYQSPDDFPEIWVNHLIE